MPRKKTESGVAKKATKSGVAVPGDYAKILADLKGQILRSRIKAMAAVNAEMISLYWEIGRAISEKEKADGWGAKVIDLLSKDLIKEFPDMKGFSPRNLLFMRQFYDAYPETEITKQPVSQIPWGHNILLIQRIENLEERLWYASQAIEHGWSRSMLAIWIDNDLYRGERKAITNFVHTLPSPQSDLAQQMTKDPYCFQFLSLEEDFRERELELGLIDNIESALMEFGKGFAFVGRQKILKVDGDEFFVDLLFYNTELHCYFVVELKTEEFKPEFAGKMNFYLGAVDRLLKKEGDNPSIGLILCRSKSKLQVEIALQDIRKPMGVSDYIVSIEKRLPKEIVSSLPTIEEIEAELIKGEVNPKRKAKAKAS